jgi:hypothetical protein
MPINPLPLDFVSWEKAYKNPYLNNNPTSAHYAIKFSDFLSKRSLDPIFDTNE